MIIEVVCLVCLLVHTVVCVVHLVKTVDVRVVK